MPRADPTPANTAPAAPIPEAQAPHSQSVDTPADTPPNTADAAIKPHPSARRIPTPTRVAP